MRAIATACAALLLALLAPHAAASEGWDQARATSLAQRLEAAADRFEEALQKEPAQTPAQGTPQSAERLRETAKRLQDASHSLAGKLGDGEGRSATEGAYQNVSQLAADGAESARRQRLSEPVRQEWEQLSTALRELAPYYEKGDAPPAERYEPTP